MQNRLQNCSQCCLKVENLGFKVADKPLLRGITHTFEAGSITAVMGTNGAGKSTLLHCLSGDLSPTEGEVWFQGKPLSQWRIEALAERRSVLGQGVDFAFPFSVAEVVSLGLEGGALSSSQQQQRLQALLADFDLLALKDHSYLTLSGGEKQRVQLARVFAQLSPDQLAQSWLFLDEWSEGLDLKHQKQVGQLIWQMARSGVGVVMILHDLNLVSQWAEHCLCLQQGQVVAEGQVTEVLQSEILSWVFEVPIEALHQGERICIQVK